jgi:hypothetical protein
MLLAAQLPEQLLCPAQRLLCRAQLNLKRLCLRRTLAKVLLQPSNLLVTDSKLLLALLQPLD